MGWLLARVGLLLLRLMVRGKALDYWQQDREVLFCSAVRASNLWTGTASSKMAAASMQPHFVYKLTTKEDEATSTTPGFLRNALDAKDGYVHMSRAHAVAPVANRFFADAPALTVLKVNPLKLHDGGEVRWVTEPPAPEDITVSLKAIRVFFCQGPFQ
ncbi:uncharacterized protein MONBRDRAFT_6149 [Monosiga brevicollis MX1]|uniref:DUF952 domain-containing protein n=1 Tax=Monosiga brevicollis TaxID=81824 RepID=A9USZ1_MONBE|nr:uncharacterized protein MONBRDRAFT_6149 [Monosiga brevicollis MX1]EDQ91405.1 predicted protein [Monosiga brevicollis MX1]|eukprot:XP_001743827.1 hypothetical protein [Monosiga brevicollis MX1]